MEEAIRNLVALLKVDPFYRETVTYFERLATESAAGDDGKQRVARQIVQVLATGQFADIVLQPSGVVLPSSRGSPLLWNV